mmetsp:Transcript_33240/g.86190  ORF Transcript_33240/g.86190 Transcript_33240/m.86190 type:complete len:247 (-) Transcript_33240:118-858(-)|eukprot:jgi/Tetstr1/434791/TSEL_023841.t1
MAFAATSTSRTAFAGARVAVSTRSAKASRAQVVVNAERKLWLPGSTPPAHLTGSLAGDFGFDPLGLGKDPAALAYYVEAELVHSRFAMAGVAGILIPSLLTHAGALNVPVWYEAGEVAIKGSSIGFGTLLMTQLLLMGWVETKRIMDFKNPGSQAEAGSFLGLEGAFKGTAPGYPGGPFDPMGMAKGNMDELKLKEIKNGRLAMLAMLGFFAEAGLGKDPVDALSEHLANPWTANFTTNGVSVPGL